MHTPFFSYRVSKNASFMVNKRTENIIYRSQELPLRRILPNTLETRMSEICGFKYFLQLYKVSGIIRIESEEATHVQFFHTTAET